MSRISVGIVSNRLNGQRSGVEVYTHNLIQGLGSRKEIALRLINRRRTIDGVDHLTVGPWMENLRTPEEIWILYLQMYLKFIDTKSDIIHSPENAGFFLRPRKAKKIITVHDTIAYQYQKHMPMRINLRYNLMFPANIKTAHRVIADSESTKRYLINLFDKPADKIDVVPLAAEDFYRPAPEDRISDFKKRMSIERPYLLYVGNFMEHKNVPRLVEAFNNLKRSGSPHQLMIAGSSHGCDRGRTLELIEKLGLKDDVRFAGYVPLEDMPLLYGAADLLVCPSLCEGFGLTPLEAMSCGTPVAVANQASLPEVVGDAGAYFDPEDPEKMSDAMIKVLGSPDRAVELGRDGLKRAKEFTWEKTTSMTMRTYERALGRE